MPSLTDERFAALRVLVPSAPPTTNDMLRQWLLDNGGTGNHIMDLWRTMLVSQGVTASHHSDMVREFLTNEGFTQPQLNDAWLAFWLAGGVPSGGAPPAGNIALQANTFENVQSFGTDQGVVGIRVTPTGGYQFVAEPDTLNPGGFWQSINFGTNWIDDGGASAAQFEAQLNPLNTGGMFNPTFTGWAGYNQWLPITQNLEFYDFNDQPASSSNGGIVEVHVRQIAVPANIVIGAWEGHADNEP
jgi:hypothetical protein